jgi:DNA-binding transcriptional LysR family regulator
MSISIRQIEAFHSVMLCGTTKAAAKMLNVSQPVISKLLSHMELRLGYSLFERTGNALIPNEKAQKLFREARFLHDRVNQFSRFASALGQAGQGSMTLLVSATLSTTIIPQILAQYHARFPAVYVDVANKAVGDIGRQLLTTPDSIGVTIWPVNDPMISCEQLSLGNVRLMLRRDHPLAGRSERLSFADLQGEALILHSNSMPLGDAIRRQMAETDCTWNVPFTVDSSETAYSLVEQGLGVFLCDAFAAMSLNARNLVTKEIESDVRTSVCLLRSRFQEENQHLKAFEDLLRDYLSKNSIKL